MFKQSTFMAVRTFQTSARAFAEAAKTSQGLVKPDLQLFGIEGRYAHALFSAASKKNCLDQVEKDLQQVKKLVNTDKNFSQFLSDPIQSRKQKKEIAQKALKNVNSTTANLFATLADNNRLANTADIIAAFEQLMSSHRHEVPVTVTSASKLDDKTLKTLKEALQGFAKKGEQLNISTKIDDSIIGGLVVDIGDKHIDMSVATKVKKISQQLRVPL